MPTLPSTTTPVATQTATPGFESEAEDVHTHIIIAATVVFTFFGLAVVMTIAVWIYRRCVLSRSKTLDTEE